MKVLHLCISDLKGGAAIGANRLHQALQSRGIQSRMLVVNKVATNDASILPILDKNTTLQQVEFNRLTRQMVELNRTELDIRSVNLFGVDVAAMINATPCDVVHFHWIGGNTIRIPDIARIERPIVWKMPDMWAFSGAEHYIDHYAEKRYKLGYDKTPPPDGIAVDVDRLVWEVKRQAYADLSLIMASPSRFMAQCAHESVLLSPYDVHVVPNPLPKEFLTAAPLPTQTRLDLRAELNLPLQRQIAVFSAFNAKEKRKGYGHVMRMLEERLEGMPPPEAISFLIIGGEKRERRSLSGYDVHVIPRIDDVARYIRVMQCADVLLCPSEMDNSAMVVQEANALGLPSVVFDVGGMPDLVVHKKTGYLAQPYSVADLTEGLRWTLRANRQELARNAQARARAMHDDYTCAASYIRLYEEALRRYHNGRSFRTGQLHDKVVEPRPKRANQTVYLIDPSVRDLDDTSHNTEVAFAFSAIFANAGYKVVWLVNERGAAENPFGETIRLFNYTAYDKVRSTVDKREGYDQTQFRGYPDTSFPPERDVIDALIKFFDTRELSNIDAFLVPMADRLLIEGLVTWRMARRTINCPKLFLNIMFEHGAFLTGGYPLDDMSAMLRNTHLLGQQIFPCTETIAMAQSLGPRFSRLPIVLRPPHLFTEDVVRLAMADLPLKTVEATAGIYKTALDRFHAKSATPTAIEKPAGEIWVAALGRGRRDKGWARLPKIVKEFNRLNPDNKTVKFVVQAPRAMDGLDDELEQMRGMRNVILLDAIIGGPDLELYCDLADIFLLPYEKNVYGNRGSAFVWRAVACCKPLLVSQFTGLEEGLLAHNGLAAADEEEFARNLGEIVVDYDEFAANAKVAAADYFRLTVLENPLLPHIERRLFVTRDLVCFVLAEDESLTPLKKFNSQSINYVVLRMTKSGSGLAPEPPARTGRAMMALDWRVDPATDKSTPLPELILEAVRNASFDAIVLPEALEFARGVFERAGAAPNNIFTYQTFAEPRNVAFDANSIATRAEQLVLSIAAPVFKIVDEFDHADRVAIGRLFAAYFSGEGEYDAVSFLGSLVEQGPEAAAHAGLSNTGYDVARDFVDPPTVATVSAAAIDGPGWSDCEPDAFFGLVRAAAATAVLPRLRVADFGQRRVFRVFCSPETPAAVIDRARITLNDEPLATITRRTEAGVWSIGCELPANEKRDSDSAFVGSELQISVVDETGKDPGRLLVGRIEVSDVIDVAMVGSGNDPAGLAIEGRAEPAVRGGDLLAAFTFDPPVPTHAEVLIRGEGQHPAGAKVRIVLDGVDAFASMHETDIGWAYRVFSATTLRPGSRVELFGPHYSGFRQVSASAVGCAPDIASPMASSIEFVKTVRKVNVVRPHSRYASLGLQLYDVGREEPPVREVVEAESDVWDAWVSTLTVETTEALVSETLGKAEVEASGTFPSVSVRLFIQDLTPFLAIDPAEWLLPDAANTGLEGKARLYGQPRPLYDKRLATLPPDEIRLLEQVGLMLPDLISRIALGPEENPIFLEMARRLQAGLLRHGPLADRLAKAAG